MEGHGFAAIFFVNSGTGKSVFATALVDRMHATFFWSDVVWKGCNASGAYLLISTTLRRMRLSKWWELTRKFSKKPREERFFLVEAVCWLGLARLAIAFVPFRRIAPVLGRTMHELPHDDSEHAFLAAGVARAVETAARHTPWESKCLARAMAAKMMLRRRGAGSTLYLGLSKDESGELLAHAWLRYGEMILTGAPEHRQCTVVATFAEDRG